MSNERDKVMGKASETISINTTFTDVDNVRGAYSQHQQAIQKA